MSNNKQKHQCNDADAWPSHIGMEKRRITQFNAVENRQMKCTLYVDYCTHRLFRRLLVDVEEGENKKNKQAAA